MKKPDSYEERVVIIPAKISIRALKGILPKPKKAATLEEMDEVIAEEAGKSLEPR